MKSLNLVTTLAIAAALMVGVTGCKKTPKAVTSIPRTNLTPIRDDIGGNPSLPPGQKGGTTPGSKLPGEGDLTSRPITDNTANTTGSRPLTADELAKAAAQNSRAPEGLDDAKTLAAETIYFDFDRSTVKSSEVPKVQRVATYLKNQPTVYLRVEGNCDERGTEEYNRSLGERRALAVRELLIASGVAPDRVSTVTFGEDKPADPGHDEGAWSKNRRADFVLVTPTANTPIQ